MVENWSYVSVEPAADADRDALIGVFESAEWFHFDAVHDGELIFSGMEGEWRARELLEAAVEHVDRATLLWETDEGPHVSGHYFEVEDDDLVEVEVVGTVSKAGAADYFALEYGIHGPV